MNAVRTIGEKVVFLEMMTNFTVNSYLNWTCGKKKSFCSLRNWQLLMYRLTFVNVEKRADPVTGSMKVVQSSTVKVLTSNDINSGVINRIRKNECGQVNGPHQNSSVNFFLALRGPTKMESASHIRRPVYIVKLNSPRSSVIPSDNRNKNKKKKKQVDDAPRYWPPESMRRNDELSMTRLVSADGL